MDGREEQTVLADKGAGPRQTRQPRFQGAVVVCEGAGRAAVKLAVTEAVASLTGRQRENRSRQSFPPTLHRGKLRNRLMNQNEGQ